MVRALIYILFFFILYSLFKLLLEALSGQKKQANEAHEAEELVQDPCCGTYISKRFSIRKRVSGKEVYFCGEECLRNYLEDRQMRGA
jgi:YHS domain-containing protein